uniref:Uncharacterized protein n=1 Tax=Rhizophora mucronata TaxID=61149 RepID=A0A2P2Q9J5_RHIMU
MFSGTMNTAQIAIYLDISSLNKQTKLLFLGITWMQEPTKSKNAEHIN